MTYDGTLPTIDMAGKKGGSVTSMFAGSNIKVAPDVINAEGVEYAGQMFENCTQLEHVGKVQLPSAISANRMFARCSRLKSIEKLDLRSCTQTNLLFSGASAGKTLSIGELVLSPEGDPFKVFCQDQSAWSGVRIGKLDTGPDDTLYDRLRASTQNGTREPGGQWLYGNYYSAVANSIRRSMSAPLRTLVGKIKRDVFAEFDFNGQDVVIKDEKFNRLITLYQDSFGSYDMTAFDGSEKLFADTVADLMRSADVAGGTRIVISDSQFESLPHASLVSFFVKPSKPGAVYVRYGENDVRLPNGDDVRRRLYSLEHPDGMVTFTDDRDRDPSIMRKFVKAIYDAAGNMVVKDAAVDITEFYGNADKI